MPQSLDILARQTLFIVKEGTLTRKLELPSEWPCQHPGSNTELTTALEALRGHKQRAMLIISEEDLGTTLPLVKQRIPAENLPRFGVVVISHDAAQLLRKSHYPPEVLDVFPDKEFRKSAELYFLGALRHLVAAEERGNPKVGQKTLERLNEIFIALSAERNPQRLLATILLKAMDLTTARGGVLYMAQETDGEIYFRLKITNDRSNEITFQHMTTRVLENSTCGYVALTGKLLNIPDVSELRALTLPQFHRSMDYSGSEDTGSLLTIPLKNSRNEIIAVLQLVNKQPEQEGEGPLFSAFEIEDESLLSSFATQAAICLENLDLYADIQRLFDGFVKASISAIESRDPSTGGHSERVAKMCVALARATTECETGIYRSVRFKEEEVRELEYAALLHDFGKIGVREEVLVKAKKLYPFQLEGIKDRIKICKAAAKINVLEKRLKHVSSASEEEWEREYEKRLREIEAYWEIIQAANEPTILKRESVETLERIRSEQLLLPDGSNIAVLSEEEYKALAVTQGSLTESERLEIESHVRHTFQFLKMIPWTKDFKHLTEIAYCHHEKLDGSGYPRGLSSHEIPLQSKIMTIADIFDALTAADRWYKEAVPTMKALDILHYEVGQGKLDPVLFEIFVEKKIYQITAPKELNQVA